MSNRVPGRNSPTPIVGFDGDTDQRVYVDDSGRLFCVLYGWDVDALAPVVIQGDSSGLYVRPSDPVPRSQVVYEDGTDLYVCIAPVGTSLSSASWQVKKVSDSSGILRVLYADGNGDFDNVATNLSAVKALSYS